MEQIAAFMLLISCSDDLSSCKEIPAPTVSYQTLHDCHVDSAHLLTEHAARQMILAACIKTDASALYSNATIVWDISKSGELNAGFILSNPKFMAAANLGTGKSTLQ